jgi:hypothetical protein
MDKEEFQKNNPNVKLGEFTEEDIPVQGIKFDPETKSVSLTTKMEKQKVMYIDAPKEKVRCKDGEHFFECVDNHKYIFSCKNCHYSRQVYPTTYKFENHKLIHRITGKVI